MEPRSRRRYALAAAAAGAAAAWLWVRRSARARIGAGAESTQFDAFLRSPAPAAAAHSAAATSFESFLRCAPAEPEPTDFASFLRDRSGGGAAAGGGGAAAQAQVEAAPAEVVPEDAVPVLVLFGTEYGFAREIAEKLCGELKAAGYWPLLNNAANLPSGLDLASQQAALLVFSTQGDGVPPTEARGFCDWLVGGGAGALPSLAYSVCALGDTAYTHFARCGRQLDAALASAGAAALAPRVDVDKEDWAAVDGWLAACLAGLAARRPLLATFAELGGVPEALAGGAAAAAAAGGGAGGGRFSKSRPYYARVVGVEGLCVLSGPDDKDTVRLRLALEPEALAAGGLDYEPGDALGIWPTNHPQAVQELLEAVGASGDEPVAAPSWHYREDAAHSEHAGAAAVPLRHALAACYDLRSPKAPQLLAALAAELQQLQGGKLQPQRVSVDLQADASGAALKQQQQQQQQQQKQKQQQKQQEPLARLRALQADAAALEGYLRGRHVIDVLHDFAPARLTHGQLLGALRPLAPRLYSISSSPLEFSPEGSGVEATIAVVRYEALGVGRRGVASTQAGERLAAGDTLPVFVSRNPDFRLPADPATPVVMVGPGTGLAPFRAFVTHRLLEARRRGAAAAGPMRLFFGCRRRDQDFLYGGQLQAWHDEGSLRLHTAFSREAPGAKVYVQQRLGEAAAEVWAELRAGGHFYVCGDAGSMAGAVEQALLRIIEERLPGGGGHAAAEAHLAELAAAGRYERDVWFS